MFSLGLPLAPKDWSGLSLAVGVSVAESLQPHLPAVGGAPKIGIKWPNDLWLEGDRKKATCVSCNKCGLSAVMGLPLACYIKEKWAIP